MVFDKIIDECFTALTKMNLMEDAPLIKVLSYTVFIFLGAFVLCFGFPWSKYAGISQLFFNVYNPDYKNIFHVSNLFNYETMLFASACTNIIYSFVSIFVIGFYFFISNKLWKKYFDIHIIIRMLLLISRCVSLYSIGFIVIIPSYIFEMNKYQISHKHTDILFKSINIFSNIEPNPWVIFFIFLAILFFGISRPIVFLENTIINKPRRVVLWFRENFSLLAFVVACVSVLLSLFIVHKIYAYQDSTRKVINYKGLGYVFCNMIIADEEISEEGKKGLRHMGCKKFSDCIVLPKAQADRCIKSGLLQNDTYQ